jgi:hypothetical protein
MTESHRTRRFTVNATEPSGSVRRVAVPLAGLTAAVIVVNFITARVAEAGDWPAFVLSAVVVLGLVLGLAWVGARVASRRT